MRALIKGVLSISLSLPLFCFAFDFKNATFAAEFGGFVSTQGKEQHLNIQGLIGNQYSVSNNDRTNGLFGLGYLFNGVNNNHFNLIYGINAFYLGKTSVAGTISQENLFTNLAYSYKTEHVPVYLAAKAIIKNENKKYNITLDAGVGPNFMHTGDYTETSLNNMTLANYSFINHGDVNFSAMAGIGLRINNLFRSIPLECGYRFFYLGEGQLGINNNQLINTIKTGNAYANAILCTVTS